MSGADGTNVCSRFSEADYVSADYFPNNSDDPVFNNDGERLNAAPSEAQTARMQFAQSADGPPPPRQHCASRHKPERYQNHSELRRLDAGYGRTCLNSGSRTAIQNLGICSASGWVLVSCTNKGAQLGSVLSLWNPVFSGDGLSANQ